jgi:hypothetical protein
MARKMNHVLISLCVAACARCAVLCTPACSLANSLPLGGLEPVTDLLGLVNIRVAGAPEEYAAGHAADRDRHATFGGDALDPMLHGGRAHAVGDRHASGVLTAIEVSSSVADRAVGPNHVKFS